MLLSQEAPSTSGKNFILMAQSCLNSKMIKVFRIKKNTDFKTTVRKISQGSALRVAHLLHRHYIAWHSLHGNQHHPHCLRRLTMILKGGKGSCTALHVKGCSSLKVEVSFMTRESQPDRKLGRFGSPPLGQMNCKQVETLQASKQSRLLL